jgi:hypothetical protein
LCGNFLINSTDTSANKRFQIDVNSSSNNKPNYDGLLIKSTTNDVSVDASFKNYGAKGVLSIGVESQTSNQGTQKSFIAYKSGTTIIPIEGEFVNSDVGSKFYWVSDNQEDTITSLNTFITSSSLNSHDSNDTLITSGTYTGIQTKRFKVEIDRINGSGDWYKWSSDGGLTYTNQNVLCSLSASNLEDGVQIAFGSTTGHTLGSYWTFTAFRSANTSSSTSHTIQKSYITRPNISFISNPTPTDMIFETADLERMRITEHGNIGIGTSNPKSRLEVVNKTGERILLSTQYQYQQINPSVCGLTNGGWVAVWESENSSGYYDIYGQIFYADGSRNGNQFQVNQSTTYNQSNPHVANGLTNTYGGFIVCWSTGNSSGLYDIKCQIYDEKLEDGSRNRSSIDLSVNTTTSYTQKYPRGCGLTNGNYMVVWESDDAGTGDTNIYYQIISRLGNLVSAETRVNSSTSNSQKYPYPTGIKSDDDNYAGGAVVVFMSEYATDVFDIKYTLYNSSLTVVNSDVSVTNGTTKTYGRPCVEGLTDGGFIISYNDAYYGDSSKWTYSVGGSKDNITGLTSGASGQVADIDEDYPTKIHITSVSGVFQDGEEITTSISGRTEKIESISYTSDIFTLGGGDVELTLSRDVKVIVAKKYDTNSTTAIYTISSVNTSEIIGDQELEDIYPSEYIREYTIFSSKLPLPSISNTNDNNFVICWTNGRIPNIYYQKFRTSNGNKIGDEILIQRDSQYLKQRNPQIAKIVNNNRDDGGWVIVYDAEVFDTHFHGVFGEIANPDNGILLAKNGISSFIVNNDGNVGIGNPKPEFAIDLYSRSPIINIRNTSNTKGDGNSSGRLVFRNGSGDILGEIKCAYSDSYSTREPRDSSLIAWYKFDETSGDQLSDNSQNNNTGTLYNFNLDRCWIKGLVSNALQFNGIDSYVSLGNGIISTVASGSFTISCWIKLYPLAGSGKINDIISNSGGATAGTYLLYLNTSSYLVGSLITNSTTSTITGSTSLNDGNWYHVAWVVNTTGTSMTLYINGSSHVSGTYSGSLVSLNTSVYMGSRNTSANFFGGVIDDFRIYNQALSSVEITRLYQNISQSRGRIIIKTNNGNNLLNDNLSGLAIDDNGRLESIKVRSQPNSTISGSLTPSGTTISGTNSIFTSELLVGDRLLINAEKTTITSINSNTSLTVNPSLVGISVDTSVERLPSIATLFDSDDNIKFLLTNQGYVGLGETNPRSLLHISGTGNSENLPYLRLQNTSNENIDGGRETKIIFEGYGTNNQQLGQIEVSHDGSGNDNKGQMKFYVNNNTSLTQIMTLDSSLNVGIGAMSEPISGAMLSLQSQPNTDLNVLFNSDASDTSVFGGKSKLYFKTANITSGSLDDKSYVKLQASSDNPLNTSHGRFDLFVNDGTTTINRMTITSSGNFGFNISQPAGFYHVAPSQYLPSSGLSASLSGLTITGVNTTFTSQMVGSVILFKSDNQQRRITAYNSATSLTVDTSGSFSTQDFEIYHAGILVNSSGNVGIGTVVPDSNLHVDGSFKFNGKYTMPFTTIVYGDTTTGNYTLPSTITNLFVNATGGSIAVNLPATANSVGRYITVKKIDSSVNTVILDGNGSETIDGSATLSLSNQYQAISILSNGSGRWYIMNSYP